MTGLALVLARHGGSWTWGDTKDDGQPIMCGCGEWRGCIVDHRAHVAAAVTAWLAEWLGSEEIAQPAAAVYWNHRQGVPLDAWTPPIEVESMRAALAAVVGALAGES